MSKFRDDPPFLTAELLQKYRDGTLAPEERAQVEAWRSQDPFAADALEGVLQASDGTTFDTDVSDLRTQLHNRSRRSRKVSTYTLPVAASIALLLIASYITYDYIFGNPPLSAIHSPAANQTSINKQEELPISPVAPVASLPPAELTNRTVSKLLPRRQVAQLSDKERPYKAIDKQFDRYEEITIESVDQRISQNQIPVIAKEAITSLPVPSVSKHAAAPSQDIRSITGQVTDQEGGDPLPGVNVLVEGTTQGGVTDIDGKYQLSIASYDSAPVLVFSAVGYANEKVPLSKKQDTANAALAADLQGLSEVVVVGYGSRSKAEESSLGTTARPKTGMRAFRRYLQDSIRYPETQRAVRKKSVRVAFSVLPDGSLDNFLIRKSEGDWYDQEAIRLIQQGPTWEAGTENGHPVAQKVTVRVRFK